jgi:dipeptidyl aminopeptidase/acylaminoacyl peptidase
VAEIPASFWIGTDEAGGIPNPGRPDVDQPPHWRLDAVAATERPRHLEVSPDGSSVALTIDRDTSDMWLLAVAGGLPVRLTTDRTLAAYWEDSGPAWSPDGTRIVYAASGKVTITPVSGGPPQALCEGSSPVWLDERRLVIAVDRGRSRNETTALAVIDVDDPWPLRLAAGPGDRGEIKVSPDSTRVASTLFHRDDLNCTSLHVTSVDTMVDVEVASTPARNVRSPAWSPDGQMLAYADETPGWYEVFVVSADGSSAPRQLTSAGADFAELRWSSDGAGILAVRYRHGVGDLVVIDTSTGDVDVLALGGTWSSPDWLADGAVVAVYESHVTPPRVCRIADGEVTELLAPTPAAVTAAPHVVPEHVTYRSLDGLDVYGWLYRPAAATADHPVPAIVYPHGGPTSHTGDEWDGIAQHFVDKGYAWFSLNFRGSTTYGRDFERANHGVWGVDDTKDCLAAHDHLSSLSWIDAARVGIFGASYGSYLALLAVVDDDQRRFACAAAKYGDCDILTSWAQGDLVGRLDLERMMGHPSQARAAYEAGSPIHRVDQLTVPILIAHGEQDERVHPKQSVELAEALRRHGKTFEYVTYKTEGHGLLRAGPMIDFYTRLARFFDWYLSFARKAKPSERA